jgi:putative transcriptional regulator
MKEHIKNCVHQLRAKTGLTQEEFALKIGVTRQTVISIEKGNYTPSVALALKIAKVCKTPVEKIFYISYEK